MDKIIADSYACIKGRGVHGAINKLQKYMCIAKRKWENPYILKYDIKKFFYSKDQKKLYEIMCKYYKDKDFLDLTRKFIKFDPENKNDNEFGVGIPIKVGVIFCGYKIYTTHKLLKRANIQRMKKRIKNWNKQYRINENDLERLNKWRQSFFAWKGYAKEAEKYNLYKTLENKCEWIDTEHI